MNSTTDEAPETLEDQAAILARAARALARESSQAKDAALLCIAAQLRAEQDAILEANQRDLLAAQDKGMPQAFLDRLRLDPLRLESIAAAVDAVRALPDPVGEVTSMWQRPNGLKVGRKRIPLGCIGIIYEARPNVTSDAAALCLKSGNAVLLKGGSDAYQSNLAIFHALQRGLRASPLSERAEQAVGFVQSTDRDAVRQMLQLDQYLDVIIPRGGKSLIEFVHQHSRIPVIKHDEGVCHLVVDGSAEPNDVDAITLNAKAQRPSVCNSIETLILLQDAVEPHLDRLLRLLTDNQIKLHLDPTSLQHAQALELPQDLYQSATDEALRAEFLALELAVIVLPSLDDAIEHIDNYGSRHTESLLTQNYSRAQQFIDEVNSSVVLVNASTRFADGNQLGLGAEIGISTTRMHAYGPMGLQELTTTKFFIYGDGQIRT